MKTEDLSSVLKNGTTTMTRQACLRRASTRAVGARVLDNVDQSREGSRTPAARTAALVPLQDQALEWSKEQGPSLSVRPHTRAENHVHLPLHGIEAAHVVSRPATRQTGMVACNVSSNLVVALSPICKALLRLVSMSGFAASSISTRRSHSVASGEFQPKYKGTRLECKSSMNNFKCM